MAPTMMTELMALVTLMSGVSVPDDVIADEDGEHEHHQVRDERIDCYSVHVI